MVVLKHGAVLLTAFIAISPPQGWIPQEKVKQSRTSE